MSDENLDDHLPPPPVKAAPRRSAEAGAASREAPAPPAPARWGDRVLFAAVGLLVGFAAAYLYLDKAGPGPSAAMPVDPHAGIPGFAEMAAQQPPPPAAPAPDPAARQRLKDAEEAAQKLPNDYTTLVNLGNAAYDAQEFDKAVEAYERALKVKDGDANVLTDLGVSYRNVGNVDKALEMFERAQKADPKHWQSIFNRVVVYAFDKKDPKKAKELLAELKKVKPDMPALAALEEEIDKAAR